MIVVYQILLPTLHDTRHGSLIATMPMLRVKCIDYALPPLQLGVEPTAKCGGQMIPTPLRCVRAVVLAS